jgi:amino acid transporter
MFCPFLAVEHTNYGRFKVSKSQNEAFSDPLEKMGYKPEFRRVLSGFSNFAMSFSLICILAGGITAFPTALSSVGGAAIGIGWLAGGLFALFVALSMSEIVSAYPTAGGLYYWSSALGGRGWGWATAWFNLAGLVFVLASVDTGAFQLIRDMALGEIWGVDVSSSAWQVGWIWYAGTAAILLSHVLINHYGIGLTRRLVDFSGYLIFVVAVLLAAALIWYAPVSIQLSRLWTFTNFTGASGGNVWPQHENMPFAFLLGLLLVTYTITGFDASAHVSEDTIDAPTNARLGILYSVLLSVIFGYLLVSAFVLALPDVAQGAAQGANVITWLLNSSRMPTAVRNCLYIGIIVVNYLCGLAGVTACSRMLFAFARDGGLPWSQKIRKVTNGNPVTAIWLSGVLAFACTLYGGAFSVLAAGSAVLLYISYVMPSASALITNHPDWHGRAFNLRSLSRPFAFMAILGGLILTFVGIQPPNQAVGYLVTGMLAAMGLAWFLVEKRRFKGPPAVKS